MYIFKKVADLQTFLNSQRKQRKTIGFAPTMGALHQGHISLIDLANKECDISVCSIFVNPTQFNDPKDLAKYPRTEERDIEMLIKGSTKVLFLPSVEEIYPPNVDTKNKFDFGDLATVLEGSFRPGHFDGMAQVVKRLLDIVQPDKLYMGQKDFQQFAIVANMLQQMQSATQIVCCAIIREEDGLAMSSRNVRLTPENRAKAPIIYQTLKEIKDKITNKNIETLRQKAFDKLANTPEFKPEYVEIVDGRTLKPIQTLKDTDFIVALVATWAGEIRLIDNLIIKS